MKTTTTQFTSYGNLAIVQFTVEPFATFPFSPGVPELKTGGLVITEATGAGIVGTLTAINNTGSYLLLTDADVLTGAKQNRVLNKSVLLNPMSKTPLDVSCVERRRWHYTSGNFDNSGNVADPDLRREKASPSASGMRVDGFGMDDTQMRVWDHVRFKMSMMNFESSTESYSELQEFRMNEKRREFPECEPEKESNGIAVFMDSKVLCADIFGTKEVYQYYFPMLRDSAFRMAQTGRSQKSPDKHEAFYKVMEAIDNLGTASRRPEETYRGSGLFSIAENDSMVGFELTMLGQMIHSAVFVRQ